ncbi:MAG: alpha/beta fold hydrolase [Chloroflexota bacterium]|nr:alpha/beta fold hydrolase [Chloroflexota bacterium]
MPGSIWNEYLGAEIKFVQGAKYRSRVAEAGKQHAETLIMTHGGGGHLETFARNVIPISQHVHVIALEILWHGLSDAPEVSDNPAGQVAEQIIDLMDAMGVEQAWLHGEAYSGSAVTQVARNHPERLKGVIYESGVGMNFKEGAIKPPAPPVGGISMPERTLQLLKDPDWDGVYKRLVMVMHRDHPEQVTDELVDTRLAHYTRPFTNDAQTRFYTSLVSGIGRRNNLSEEEMAETGGIKTLVVWCDGSAGAGPDAGERLAGILGAQFKLLPQTGFWAHWENPGEFNKAVVQFVKGETVT